MHIPTSIPNWINGRELPARNREVVGKLSPATGRPLWTLARSGATDIDEAVASARAAQPSWGGRPAPQRGAVLFEFARRMQDERDAIAEVVAAETGKSLRDARGETDGAIALAHFFAGEGQRLYGRTLQSAVPNKYSQTIRQPLGVAGLIVAANTPVANVAWKIFPALICGNAAVLKMTEDAPATAWLIGRIARDAGLPDGVLNIVQGLGREAGAPLVEHPGVDVVSFTGSTAVGRWIAETCGRRLARVSLELGGKNPLVVCDDADLDNAVRWSVLSAFSNAGQRCASASRIIVFDNVYEEFRERFLSATAQLRLGPTDDDDLGPVINERQLGNMLDAVSAARDEGISILTGGERLDDPLHAEGFYMAPTVFENASQGSPISRRELFGPIAGLYRAEGFEHALTLANDTEYGLTACIHTASLHRATEFSMRVRAGVVMVNAGTFGSEPHFPFGGFGQSGNGTREPGVEAIEVYSETKAIHIISA